MWYIYGLPWWLSGKESVCNARDAGDVSEIPGSGRSPGGGHGNPLQYSCLENPKNRGAWWAAIYAVAQSQKQLNQLSNSSSSYIVFNIAILYILYLSTWKKSYDQHRQHIKK